MEKEWTWLKTSQRGGSNPLNPPPGSAPDLQEATNKTFSFTVSWQKQIKFYFSPQNWVVI